jgi:hypothetical protein
LQKKAAGKNYHVANGFSTTAIRHIATNFILKLLEVAMHCHGSKNTLICFPIVPKGLRGRPRPVPAIVRGRPSCLRSRVTMGISSHCRNSGVCRSSFGILCRHAHYFSIQCFVFFLGAVVTFRSFHNLLSFSLISKEPSGGTILGENITPCTSLNSL